MFFAVFDRILPKVMNDPAYTVAGMTPAQWLGLIGIVAIGLLAAPLLTRLVIWITQIIAQRTKMEWDDKLIATFPGPLRLFLVFFVIGLLLVVLELRGDIAAFIHQLLACGIIIAVAWLILRSLAVGAEATEKYFNKGIEGTPQARAVHTQISVVRAILRFIIIIAGIALGLIQFPAARTIGLSLLASASIAGIAVGFAANRIVATLFAGIQIAFTQTIKIGDVVVVEGEWGRIEEIRLTHVVVKIWDLRRLILPVTYFTEKPFENWTTTGTEVLGTVYLQTDYSVPIDELRAELKRILENTDLWDGKASGVVVTDLTESGAKVRCLISAADSGKQWDLRCLVREKMLQWLQSRGDALLPTHRIQAKGAPGNSPLAPPAVTDNK